MKKKLLISIVLLILLSTVYLFIAHPFKVARGNVGKYKEGEYIFAVSRKILSNRPLKESDVIIYSIPGSFGEWGIGRVDGIPGDKVEEAYYRSGEKLDESVPAGFYVINQRGILKVIPDINISYLVWFPIR